MIDSAGLAGPKRFGWIFAALVADLGMGVLTFTPLAWQIGGGGETYPELLYAGLGLPLALIGTVAAGVIVWQAGVDKVSIWPVKALKGVVVASLCICVWLALLIWPRIPLPADGVLEALFSVVLPTLAVIAISSSIALVRRHPKRSSSDRG